MPCHSAVQPGCAQRRAVCGASGQRVCITYESFADEWRKAEWLPTDYGFRSPLVTGQLLVPVLAINSSAQQRPYRSCSFPYFQVAVVTAGNGCALLATLGTHNGPSRAALAAKPYTLTPPVAALVSGTEEAIQVHAELLSRRGYDVTVFVSGAGMSATSAQHSATSAQDSHAVNQVAWCMGCQVPRGVADVRIQIRRPNDETCVGQTCSPAGEAFAQLLLADGYGSALPPYPRTGLTSATSIPGLARH